MHLRAANAYVWENKADYRTSNVLISVRRTVYYYKAKITEHNSIFCSVFCGDELNEFNLDSTGIPPIRIETYGQISNDLSSKCGKQIKM